ncbi:MAG: hypothetical protein H8E44_41580, partial [Planctomycetes bacterium]|nr:hypothetical protein [Planctomycetota bacterium]
AGTVQIVLNTFSGDETTAEQLADAINSHMVARQLVEAEVVTAAGSEFTVVSTGATIPIVPAAAMTLTLAGGQEMTAEAHSDFDTNGAVDFRFRALAAGDGGNSITVVVTESDHGGAGAPTITVTDTDGDTINDRITIDLNTNLGNETTAGEVVAAINGHATAGTMVVADIVPPSEIKLTDGDPANYSPPLIPAYSIASDFDTGGLAEIQFKAGDGVQELVTIVITEDSDASLTGDVPPAIQVPTGTSTILAELNVDGGNETTAQEFVDAINGHADANALVAAAVLSGDAQDITIGDPANYSPLQMDLRNQFGPLTLAGANAAQYMSDFNGTNLEIRLTAVQAGEDGNDIQVRVESADLGADVLPDVQKIDNTTIEITLNSNTTTPTTAKQFVDAINGHAQANAMIDAEILWGDPLETLGDETIDYSPVQLTGADDVTITPGYVGLENDDPGTDNADPDEADRLNRNKVIFRFAETLPDDYYRMEIFGFEDAGQKISALKNVGGTFFAPSDANADREVVDFELELGPQVISVVPQPVSRVIQVNLGGTVTNNDFTLQFQGVPTPQIANADTASAGDVKNALTLQANSIIDPDEITVTGNAGGPWEIVFHGRYLNVPRSSLVSDEPFVEIEYLHETIQPSKLHQERDTVLVYFSDDPLDPALAQDPKFYQVVDTAGTHPQTDGGTLFPNQNADDAGADLCRLVVGDDNKPPPRCGLPSANNRFNNWVAA